MHRASNLATVRAVPQAAMDKILACLTALQEDTDQKVAFLSEEGRARALQIWYEAEQGGPLPIAGEGRLSNVAFQDSLRNAQGIMQSQSKEMAVNMAQENVFIALSHGTQGDGEELLHKVRTVASEPKMPQRNTLHRHTSKEPGVLPGGGGLVLKRATTGGLQIAEERPLADLPKPKRP